jgi:Ser/Thr protein kinase RdoA (MazF antagonist)
MTKNEHLARRALESYGLNKIRLRLRQAERQIVFEVWAGSGNSRRMVTDASHFALRIYPACNQRALWSQCQWLQALIRDTRLLVPKPIVDLSGRLVGSGEHDNRRFYCTLTEWVAGQPRFRQNGPGVEVLRRVGRFMAALHTHGQNYKTPPGFRCPRWDWSGLFGRFSLWAPDRSPRIDRSTLRFFDEVMKRAKLTMKTLGYGPDVFGLIHGDLIQSNYVVHGNRVGAVDFGDFGLGHFLYDMAVTLLMLKPFDPHGRQRKSFIDGYRKIRPLTLEHESLLDVFIAARAVALSRWICGAKAPSKASLAWVAQTVAWLKA